MTILVSLLSTPLLAYNAEACKSYANAKNVILTDQKSTLDTPFTRFECIDAFKTLRMTAQLDAVDLHSVGEPELKTLRSEEIQMTKKTICPYLKTEFEFANAVQIYFNDSKGRFLFSALVDQEACE